MSPHALDRMADAIERLAFQMPAPNEWTPQFVALAVAAREQANELRRTSALAGGGEAVGYIAQYSLDALNACRNDEHNGYANIWMRPRDSETIPLFTHPAGAVQIPEGYVLLPRRLTAENGAKGLLSGEFAEGFEMNCGECDSVDEDTAQHCDVCNGHGTYRVDTPIGWNTIKDIYRMIVDNLALNPGDSRE